MDHEINVERFYSTGARIDSTGHDDIRHRTWEFLSFGYWEKGTRSYLEAASDLLSVFLDKSGIRNPGSILSVACGYGTETFSCFERFSPKHIYGVDVTQKHVDYSANKARQMQLDSSVHFNHGNACALDFPANSFSHIIGIEGPVHFDTRKSFFSEAQRVLKKKGELILTDIILGSKLNTISRLHRRILRFTAKHWFVPDANWVDSDQYKKQLKGAGFSSVHLEKIGDMVFPGYARNAFTLSTVKNRLVQRGIAATIGLTIISYLLGYLYKRKIIEYIFVKANV